MGWTPDKPRKPEVAIVMGQIKHMAEMHGLHLFKYAAQTRDPQTPRRYTLMAHNSPTKPRRSVECMGPGCSWFGRKKGKEASQVQVLRAMLQSLRDKSWEDFHQETLHETKRRNK